jgi:tRNA(Arg) A34 adenosine deaminase TadA
MTTSPSDPDGPQSDLLPFLRQAIDLAVDNVIEGQLPFAALVVRHGTVLGTGLNTALRDDDPTAHAEVAAVRNACLTHGTLDLHGATVVASCEPCAMCHTACLVAGIGEVVYAAPKELVPGFDTTPGILTEFQTLLRGAAPRTVRHVPMPGADAPFRRYVEKTEDQR